MSLQIQLDTEIRNVSLQIGDIAYYITPTKDIVSQYNNNNEIIVQGFDMVDSMFNPVIIGQITDIGPSIITIEFEQATPSPGDFIMFQKDKEANSTSLLGYYAEVKLSNNSIDPAELFALSSEAAPSSK